MAFPPGFLDELRGRISLAGLVGRRVRLTRRGREHAGLCPFHNEKTPSFYVVEDKGFFHCFGCGAHGDAIGFAMRADNLDFVEAVERLAGEAGLPVPQQTPQDRERAQRQKTLLEALAAAAAFYEEQLWSRSGARGRDYLLGRGLDEETMRRFRLGWAGEDRHSLRRALIPEFPEPLLIEAGLLRRPEAGEPHDYFRDRVIFPIGDRAGRPIAFGGRTIAPTGPGAQPKYLNSPEHPLFEKGRVLYGWAAARAHLGRDETASAIVTEGYMDVIALHRAGFGAAVAPLGTALTEAQLQELWRLSPEPILCLDGDAAGQRAARRALYKALPLLQPGHSLRFAALPAGEDPDSLMRRAGQNAFAAVLAAARPLSEVLWETEKTDHPIDTPERIAALRRRLDEDVGRISERTVQQQYRAYLRDQFDGLWAERRAKRLRPQSARKIGEPWVVEERPRPAPAPARRQRQILLRILLEFPALIDAVEEDLAALELPEPEFESLRQELLRVQALRPGLDAEALRQHLESNGFAAAVQTILLPSVDSRFLRRRSDLASARSGWDHVMQMLMGGDRADVAEASDDLIRDVSPESWERFLAARQQILHRQPDMPDDDES